MPHIILGLAFDIERDQSTASGYRPAEYDLGVGLSLFGDLRLHGFAVAIQSGLAERIILAGGDEGRYKEEQPIINRAEAIKAMLEADFGIDPNLVTAFPSRSNTGGNIAIFAREIESSGRQQSDFALMTNLYHLPRASIDMAAKGLLGVNAIAAEAALLYANPACKEAIIRRLGEGSLAERYAEEAAGIADKLRGTYKPRTDVAPVDIGAIVAGNA